MADVKCQMLSVREELDAAKDEALVQPAEAHAAQKAAEKFKGLEAAYKEEANMLIAEIAAVKAAAEQAHAAQKAAERMVSIMDELAALKRA